MEISFLLVIFTFLSFQTLALSGNTITTSSNVTCIERERHSLLVFKQSLTDTYNLLSTWSGAECCEWRGVWCDSRKGHVVKLELHDKSLEGKLSPSLHNLKHLRYLDLSVNSFSGNIPKFLGLFEHLEYLNLSSSGFDGVVPHQLGNLSRLQYLDLGNNLYSANGSRALFMDDLRWVSSLLSLRYLDLTAIAIGKVINWFHPVNMLSSLLTMNLAYSDINLPSIEFVNFTSLNSLDLSRNDINSTIPMWLSNLTGLMHLDLNQNRFHGKIPDSVRMLSALAYVDLSYNSFDNLTTDLLCNMRNLVYLDLSNNFFETSMPDMLSNLSSLTHLYLSKNMFYGPIPESLGLLSSLEDLYLHYNQLSGNIPMSLGQLSKLRNLALTDNSLVGVLSEVHFTKLKNLNYLDLKRNSLGFNFSSQWIPPFQLRTFFADSCNIGPRFPNWLQTQTNLQKLGISNSSIIDTIPKWFEKILSGIDFLDLSNNQIGGKLPQFDHVGILRMNSNKFEGSLDTFPLNVYVLDLSDNLLQGYVPQTDGTGNQQLEILNLSKNRFIGSIPIQFCKYFRIILLDLSQNNFSGRLPECLGNLINLEVLDLSNNTLTGVVPSSLGSLQSLLSLHLHNNRFEGNIPVSLQNLRALYTMDLGNNLFLGSIPFWIGETVSYLGYLNLESNKFTGKIPLQLCQLKKVQYLSLARNKLTGMIPRCFGNLSGMRNHDNFSNYISDYEENILAWMKGRQLMYTKITLEFLTSLDLSSNNIVGEIPDTLMNLVELRNLNLAGNLLKGQIPKAIGDLKQLESLDLSLNKLFGRIPQSLTSLNFLSYLNLSFNNLSGPIPVGNQIQTLDDLSIYEGNNGLCGPPVSTSCKLFNNHAGEKEGHNDSEGVWFYAGMGPGFAAGFIGLLGSLHFIRSWRLAYFETLENVYGWLRLSIELNLIRLRRKVFE